MDRILVSTVVYRSPETIFPYLRAFENYPRYTKYLKEVRERDERGETGRIGDDAATASGRQPDGGTGTRYDLRFAWWKLTYTARSEVTDVTEPTSLEWRLVKDVDARGEWRVEPEPDAAPDGVETASRIYFEAVYDPHSADEDAVSLPRLISLDRVIAKIQPKLLEEARRVVSRLVTDIEGESREVELTIHEMP